MMVVPSEAKRSYKRERATLPCGVNATLLATVGREKDMERVVIHSRDSGVTQTHRRGAEQPGRF